MQSLVSFAVTVLSVLIGFLIIFYTRPKAFRGSARIERSSLNTASRDRASWSASACANEALLQTLRHSTLCVDQDDAQITLSLHKQAPDMEITVCDYRYATGFAHIKQLHRQTVLVARTPSMILPSFLLRPSTRMKRLQDTIVPRSINIPDRPVFSQRYLLCGSDADAVRGIFHPLVLDMLENMKPINLEGRGDTLIMYRRSEVVPSDQLDAFVKQGQRLSASFVRP